MVLNGFKKCFRVQIVLMQWLCNHYRNNQSKCTVPGATAKQIYSSAIIFKCYTQPSIVLHNYESFYFFNFSLKSINIDEQSNKLNYLIFNKNMHSVKFIDRMLLVY